GRLVHRDEAGRVERAEEERLPALAPRLDRCGIEAVRPAARTQVGEVEDRRAREQRDERGPLPPERARARPDRDCDRAHRAASRNTQTRRSAKRRTVAARFAAVRTASSAARGACGLVVCSSASEPAVSAQAATKTASPCA